MQSVLQRTGVSRESAGSLPYGSVLPLIRMPCFVRVPGWVLSFLLSRL